ncbi:MAG: regulatory protein RecX [Pseudomonadota bacterium]|nr:regulatory protein RecX [Pseudomonadota bacterium]
MRDKSPVEVRSSDVRRAAMDLLARREHSSQEMITKLKRRFRKRLEGDDLYHDVVDELVADGLLSDERYAASMARQLVNRGCGPKKLSFELRQKGCDPGSAVDSAFPDGIDWYALAEDVYKRKFGGKPLPSDWDSKQKERAKRGRFMASRGFSPSHFMHLLEATSGEMEQQDL